MNQNQRNNELIDVVESLLDENRTLSFRMHGNSMYPTLKEGDLGQVDKCRPEDLKIGDIVVFKSQEKLVAHRLIEIFYLKTVKMFRTKGDKNVHNDLPFSADELVGKMISFQRKGRIHKINSDGMKIRQFISMHFSKMLIPFFDLTFRLKSQFSRLSSAYHSLRNNLAIVSEKSSGIFWVNAIISVLQGLVPFALIVCIKFLIDHLTKTTQNDPRQQVFFIFLLVVTALVFLLSGILSEISSYFSEKLSQSVTRNIYEKLHLKHTELDLANYENPEKQDKIHRAVQEASFRPVKILNALLTGIKSVASSLFLLGIFLSIRWYLILILLVAIIPGILVRLKFSKKLYKLKKLQSTKEREMYYFNRILTGFPFAKELKLFGFFGFFKKRFNSAQEVLFEQKLELRKSEIGWGIATQVFAVALIFISLGFISYLKLSGAITIGTVVLFFFAFQRGYSVLNDFFRSITQILEDNTFLKDFIDFLNLEQKSKKVNGSKSFSLKTEIRIENLNFRYESSKRNALKSVNLTIPAGKTVAFVGANGSGKTTLIKLLCGFYEPDSGQILFDGTDLHSIGQNKIRENITAVFQDFALYNLPAIENLSLGNSLIPFDEQRAKNAAKAAGIDGILEQLPNGYQTLLGNLFQSGEELSIGQWQKIAIARAFYRDSDLILMDEPSSALDADAEMQIIGSLKKLSHEKTAVIVSHRLTTVQWADLIYFFEEGEVVESGNHQQLMALKGKYFTLFQTAAGRFD